MDWFANEDFWKDMYEFMFPPSRFEATPEEVDQLLEFTGISKGAVLDLCCGPGRHSVELARRGFQVTGVDLSQFLLGKAIEHAKLVDIGNVEWVNSNMRDFIRPETFDLAVSMFTSFGYFDSHEDNIKVLRNIHTSLKPDGILVVDVCGKEWLAKNFLPSTVNELEDGTLLVQRHKVVDDWSRVDNEWILLKDGKSKSFKFRHFVYTGQELKLLLESAGFKTVKIFGGLDGKEYGLNCSRLVVIAKNQG